MNQQLLRRVSGGGNGRTWIHPPDALQRGHIAYLVKVRRTKAVICTSRAGERAYPLFLIKCDPASAALKINHIQWSVVAMLLYTTRCLCEVVALLLLAGVEGYCQDAENYF